MDEVRESRKCWHCGKELTDRNSWMATDGFDPGVPSFFCVGCQSTYNVGLSKLVGPDMAFFICCAMFNVPFIPEAVSAAKTYKAERGVWGAYIKVLRDAKYHRMSDKWYGFSDGETDIRKALGMEDLNITTPDDEKIAKAKQELLNKERWGTGPKSRRYKEDDYDELNGLYDAMTKDRVAMSDQSEISVRNICKWSLERDRCIEEKDFNAAQKLSSMIEKEKESEQLRKKDEMPQDLARLDDIVKAVERAGLHIMDYEELKKELATYMFHTPYGYTRDAADQMLLLIRNCTAWNEGIPEVDRLEEEFAIIDQLGEFATEQDDEERQIYKDLQIAPLHMDGDKDG